MRQGLENGVWHIKFYHYFYFHLAVTGQLFHVWDGEWEEEGLSLFIPISVLAYELMYTQDQSVFLELSKPANVETKEFLKPNTAIPS